MGEQEVYVPIMCPKDSHVINPGELAYTCKTKILIFWLLANEKEEKFASNAKTVY